MVQLFLFILILLTIASILLSKKIINPASIYNIIWGLMVVLYELKLVSYNNLFRETWIVLFLSIIIFNVSYSFGFLFSSKVKTQNKPEISKNNLIKLIVVTSFISSIAIIPNFIILATKYGFMELLNSISEVYIDRVEGAVYVGYFSPLVNISLILSGYYFIKNGWNKVISIPIILSIINAVSFGGRNNVIISLLSFAIPIVFSYDFKKIKLKKFLLTISIIILFFVFFNLINVERSSITTVSPYSGLFLYQFNNKFPGTYKLYTYFTSPLGVLNEYLKDPFYSFGANSFLPFYKQLVKVGFNINLLWTLPFYYIPISSNVGTYLTELFIDFSIIGGLVVVALIGVMIGVSYRRAFIDKKLNSVLIFSSFMVIIMMSFFMWYFRSINTWIIILGSLIVGNINFSKKTNRKEFKL